MLVANTPGSTVALPSPITEVEYVLVTLSDGVDGFQLCRTLTQRANRTPVIIVTANGSEADRRRGIEAGADAYIAKDAFDQQTLLAAVERLVGR